MADLITSIPVRVTFSGSLKHYSLDFSRGDVMRDVKAAHEEIQAARLDGQRDRFIHSIYPLHSLTAPYYHSLYMNDTPTPSSKKKMLEEIAAAEQHLATLKAQAQQLDAAEDRYALKPAPKNPWNGSWFTNEYSQPTLEASNVLWKAAELIAWMTATPKLRQADARDSTYGQKPFEVIIGGVTGSCTARAVHPNILYPQEYTSGRIFHHQQKPVAEAVAKFLDQLFALRPD